MSIKDISKLVENLKALEIMKEELTGEIDSIKDELKQELKRRETEEMLAGALRLMLCLLTASCLKSMKQCWHIHLHFPIL